MAYQYLLSFLIIIVSCTTKENKSHQKYQLMKIKRDSIENVKNNLLRNIISDYSCTIGWDTSNLFTYEIAERLDSSSTILLNGTIIDVTKAETDYYLYILHEASSEETNNEFIAKVKVPQNLWDHEKYNSNSDNLSGYFVMSVSKIESMPIKFFADAELDYDNCSAFIDVSMSEKLVFISGELIKSINKIKY
jgi:hypothetical protein